jgi:hypothetical protein
MTEELPVVKRRSNEVTERRRGVRRTLSSCARGVVLLEVLIALAILILGMAAVGMQVNVGLRVANNSEVATRAVMLAESKMAELDAGIVQITPNQELEGDFGILYPGWAWRIYIDQTDTPDLNMVTLQVLYRPGVAFREELSDFTDMTVVHTSYTLRATPATMDLQRDFGFTDEQLQQVSDSIPIPNFDPKNIDPTSLAQLPPDQLAEVLPQLMKLLGANAALLNTLPQATRNQINKAIDQANKAGAAQGGGGSGDASSGENAGVPDAGALPMPGQAGQAGQGRGGGRGGRGGNRSGNRTGGANGTDNGPRPNRGGRRGGAGGNDSGSPGGFSRGGGPNDGTAGPPRFGGGGDASGAGSGSSRFGGGSRLGSGGANPFGGDGAGGGNPGSRFGDSTGTGGRRGSGFNGSRFNNRGGSGSGTTGGGPRGPGRGGFNGPGGRVPSGDGLSPPYRVPTEQDLYNRNYNQNRRGNR